MSESPPVEQPPLEQPTPPVDVIPWYQSTVIWTQLVGSFAGVLTIFGVHVLDDPAKQLAIVGLIVTVATIYFRLRSTETIRVKK